MQRPAQRRIRRLDDPRSDAREVIPNSTSNGDKPERSVGQTVYVTVR